MLLIGNSQRISVSDFLYGNYSLNQVELLTLSACKTGISGVAPDGSEIEGFSALAQNQGAAAVLSTLWSVADESTSIFMHDFYEAAADQGTTKMEALQLAQQAFIDSSGTEQVYSHPFYWAPFVLTGNWL
jgi:CHAT domain-containing protein